MSYYVISCYFFQVNPVPEKKNYRIPFLNEKSKWADFLLANITQEQKAGQMIMVEVDARMESVKDSLKYWIDNFFIGGLSITHADVSGFVELSNYAQTITKVPLFISGDTFTEPELQPPPPMNMASTANDSLIDEFMQRYAESRKKLNINLVFAPVIDKFSHKKSDFSSTYSDSAAIIVRYARRMLQILTNKRVLSCAKHFADYQYLESDTLPLTKYDEIAKALIEKGIPALMLHGQLNFGQSLSEMKEQAVLSFLKEHYNFQGLIFSEIQATGFDERTRIARTIKSGCDIIIVKENITKNLQTIKDFLPSEMISNATINKKAEKILQAKSWISLNRLSLRDEKEVNAYFHEPKRILQLRNWFEAGITLVKNRKRIIPLAISEKKKFACVHIGNTSFSPFDSLVSYYAPISSFYYPTKKSDTIPALSYRKFRRYSTLIVAIDKHIAIDTLRDVRFLHSLKKLDKRKDIVVVNFATPCNLNYFNTCGIVQCYSSHTFAQELSAQMLFGGIETKSQLPVYVSEQIPFGCGETTKKCRLKYSIPEDAGLSSEKLAEIDTVINEAIKTKATPGSQFILIKDGIVVLNKAYGYHTYQKDVPVSHFHLYDVASITKVAATTLSVMKLFENDSISLTDSLKSYLADTVHTTLKDITIQQLLTHRSGLQADMPIIDFIKYMDTLHCRFHHLFSEKPESIFNIEVAEDFYMNKVYLDTLWFIINNLEVDTVPGYKYSDVNFSVLYQIITSKLDTTMDIFLENSIYLPLGLRYMTFNPLDKFEQSQIVPTQNDRYWRKQLVHGYVHDPAAALYGGVAGNAGLFSNANDLGVLFQMLLNGGVYGGKRYFETETVRLFTSSQPETSRGLGFNRKNTSFGHTGFTGSCVWADPVNQIIIIFLSNRIHPFVSNQKLIDEKIRSRIYDIVYESVKDKKL